MKKRKSKPQKNGKLGFKNVGKKFPRFSRFPRFPSFWSGPWQRSFGLENLDLVPGLS